jgi:hypothetical protein
MVYLASAVVAALVGAAGVARANPGVDYFSSVKCADPKNQPLFTAEGWK